MDEPLKQELLKMAARDEAVRDELVASGELFDGYHPSMERVHLEHAERLAAIVAQYGWPGVERVGADGEEAAWLILQHAISDP
ncbi:MAG TPA: DUF6624 domain-containing protein, partial [Vicinamibacteria bacterium]|nr:DUF6624 domain-containing protein [Vicinamibacteria bacterium]